MPTARSNALLLFLGLGFALASAGPASADAQPGSEGDVEAAPEPAQAGAPDPVLVFAKDHDVIIALQDGARARGRLVAFDAQSLTLVERDTRQLRAYLRAAIVGVQLDDGMMASQAPERDERPTAPAEPPKERHLGLQIYQGPGNLMVDLDYGHFYGYFGTSIGYPIIFSGTFNPTAGNSNDSQYLAAVLGLGGAWRLAPNSNWKFDLTGTVIPTYWSGFSMGIGITAGFHYTAPSGFTVGFKVPVFGIAPGCSETLGERDYNPTTYESIGCPKLKKGSDMIANYYLQAGMTLPIISLGYRF